MINKKTPFFTISKSVCLEQFDKVRELADIVSYSSKTNPDVTKILEENRDCMFSIHTIYELKNIKDYSRILFLAQGLSSELLEDLIVKKNINWFVIDNESDLDILLNFISKKELKNKINLLLRFKLKEYSIRTERYYVFGMRSKVIKKRVDDIVKSDIYKKVGYLGIHFHRKTQNISEWNLKYDLENSFDEDFFNKIDIINIGGGLPSIYANTNNYNIFNSIFNKVMEFKKWLNSNNIKLMIEPGRFIAAPAGKLYTKIIGIDENTIIVDASVYNGDLDALIVPVKLLVEGEHSKSDFGKVDNLKMYTIKGCTPCSMDIFRYRVYLKTKKVGDIITFINAGAYNFYSDFCDLEKLKTYIVN